MAYGSGEGPGVRPEGGSAPQAVGIPRFDTPSAVQGSQPLGQIHGEFAASLLHRRTSPEVGGGADLLTVSQVAARLRVKPVTVYRLCQRGELAHLRVSNALRVEAAELERFLVSIRGREKD